MSDYKSVPLPQVYKHKEDSVPLLSIDCKTGVIGRFVRRIEPVKGDHPGQWPRLIETNRWLVPADQIMQLGADGLVEQLRTTGVA